MSEAAFRGGGGSECFCHPSSPRAVPLRVPLITVIKWLFADGIREMGLFSEVMLGVASVVSGKYPIAVIHEMRRFAIGCWIRWG